jgi:hypothetical protein
VRRKGSRDEREIAAELRYYFGIVKTILFSVAALLAGTTALHAAINQSCKAGSEDASIVRVHGRLSLYNGGYPNLRLWRIGTNHLLGVYGDPEDLRCAREATCDGNEHTSLPSGLQRVNFREFSVYADFKIRPLEPFKPGHMQAACIVSAARIVHKRAD